MAEPGVQDVAVVGVVLAGGLARRMGGGDKGLKHLAGRPVLDWVVDRARPQVAGLALNANGDPARFTAWSLPVLPDPVPGFVGPLAGVLAGLDWAAARGATWLVSFACDAPFLPTDLVARLQAARAAAGTPLACACSGGRDHPVVGLWATALREDLRQALTQEGLRKVDVWTARHGLARADFAAEPFDPFFNANRPEDLDAAEGLVRSGAVAVSASR